MTKKIFFIALLFIGCDAILGEEIGRIKINALSKTENMIIKEIILDLNQPEVLAIWSEMDIEYEDNVFLRFKLQVIKDGDSKHVLEIDPFVKEISFNEKKYTNDDKTTWEFSGKHDEINFEEKGRYIVKAFLVSSDNPTLKINKAEIVIRR